MRIVYKKRTSDRIYEAVEQATRDGVKIDYIVLTREELEDLKDEYVVPLICARVVEDGDMRSPCSNGYRMFAGVEIFLEGEKE